MSLLSDRQIRALCIPPETFFDREAYDREVHESSTMGEATPAFATFGAFQDHAIQRTRERMARHTRVLTAEEKAAFQPMLEPFEPSLIRQLIHQHELVSNGQLITKPGLTRKLLSYGTSSYGYDIRIGEEMKIFNTVGVTEINPKKFEEKCLVVAEVRTDEEGGRYVLLPPGGYLLGHTLEYFRIPRDVTALFIGKSTYARAAVLINVTPAEAGWHGQLVVEIANLAPAPVRIYANEGIAQALFLKGDEACEVSYEDRGGKYMGQRGITLAKV